MNRRAMARSVGWTQILLGVLLGVASVTVFTMYRSSLGSVSASLAESMVTVSDGLKQIATLINERQVLIDDTGSSIRSARQAVADTQALVEVQAKQRPAYSENFTALSATTSSLGGIFVSMGEHLAFSDRDRW
jgi:hypothetical protein